MEIGPDTVAVVTGAAGGIGNGLAEALARAGASVVLADVDEAALHAAAERVGALGVDTLAVRTDVSQEAEVQALAAAATDRFGAVHLVCNNAGVSTRTDPWMGPLSAWEWVVGVNLWGVVHGIRVFLPVLLQAGGGHLVNTASIAGLIPGIAPIYDATKHAVVALSEDLYLAMGLAGLPIGVSVLCPGWVRTGIADADRNWPARLGERPPPSPAAAVVDPHVRRAIDEGATPGAIADEVLRAVRQDEFWILPHPELVEPAVERFHRIAERRNPEPVPIPGFPSPESLADEIRAALFGPSGPA
jgi:NAD(P)-dependent dehydrogenase (short-subunit alcohol dehydrogenase family)